ncbi:succinylglutamate desuccinylase/aspartoacylase domain-containing protein [Luteithermobacter gelatinilyticus]|uniref:succinylglutamate desuccinylase/aspartoacylase domain-containing protein n=1 Tax=Luteithermobacter gelatinilyticus TaxID=2582913 RepID=UPI00143D916D|nr:succinylglutamate desuccinylase/aspartoacylase family protein [Luteithermobacter gelatinilyticus]
MTASDTINIWIDPPEEELGNSLKDFLTRLGGPTWIQITGKDSSRCRGVVTLLHGNEPSGAKALFHWLKNRPVPQVTLHFLICSVRAALTPPEFSHRFLPGHADINRCFRPPYAGPEGKLAKQILHHLRQLKPEAVLDIHNTSGSGPDFAVTSHLTEQHKMLAAQLSHRLIYTGIHLGALMEAEIGAPIITLEAGGCWDMEADRTALKAIETFGGLDTLFSPAADASTWPEIDLYAHPLRVELQFGTTLAYGPHRMPNINVTLHEDIERYNFGVTGKDVALGWLDEQGLDRFLVLDYDGRNLARELFYERDGILFTTCDLRLFMVTTQPHLALSDCLFYLVRT